MCSSDLFPSHDKTLIKKGLDIEEQKLIKDIVFGMLEIASKGAGAALGAKVSKTDIQ